MAAIVGGRLLIDGLSGDRRESLAAEVIAGRLQLALAAGGTHVLRSPEHHAFTAKKSGNGYVISGRMPVVLNADRADRLIIAARTGGAMGERQGITLFLLPADATGISRRPFRMIDGHGAAEVVIENLAAGADAILRSEEQSSELQNLMST